MPSPALNGTAVKLDAGQRQRPGLVMSVTFRTIRVINIIAIEATGLKDELP